MAIYKLGEIANILDGYHGGFPNGSEIPFISAKDIFWEKINLNTKMISIENYKIAKSRSQIFRNTILFTNSGTLGKIHFCKENMNVAMQKSIATINIKSNKILSKYLVHLLKVKSFEQINIATGSAQKNILLKDLRAWKLNFPNLKTQQQIIDIIEPLEKLKLIISKLKNTLYKLANYKNFNLISNYINWYSNGFSYKKNHKGNGIFKIFTIRNILNRTKWELTHLVKNNKLEIGDVITGLSGTIGTAWIVTEKNWVSNQRTIAIRTSFPVQILKVIKNNKFILLLNSTGAVQKNIKSSDILNISFGISNYQKEKRISDLYIVISKIEDLLKKQIKLLIKLLIK